MGLTLENYAPLAFLMGLALLIGLSMISYRSLNELIKTADQRVMKPGRAGSDAPPGAETFGRGETMHGKCNNRFMEILAIGMIGEGIIGAIRPRRYMRLWRFGPKAYRNFIDALARRPQATRLMFVAEAGLGVWLALRNTR